MGPLLGARAAYYMQKIRRAEGRRIVPIDRMDDMFEPRRQPIDAFVLTAEAGVGVYLAPSGIPVAVPKPRAFAVPLAA